MDPVAEENILDPLERMVCPFCGVKLDCSELPPLTRLDCPECGEEITVPGRIGDFRIEGRLGKGAMGEVFRAFDEKLQRWVAVKVMERQHPRNCENPDAFLTEARAVAALNDPNIVQVHSLGEQRGHAYIVMELVDGQAMDTYLWRNGAADEAETLKVACSVVRGLEAAYRAELIHGDIKPGNILVTPGGAIKILDFGLAHSIREGKPGDAWGSPYYIAPECLAQSEEDHRTDMYSLGATLFHILAGRPPFEGKKAREVAAKRLNELPPDIQSLRPELSNKTARTLNRMLKFDRSDRHPTHASLLGDLENALQQFSTPRPSSRRMYQNEPAAAPMALRLVFGGFVFCLLSVLGWGVWHMLTQTEKEADPIPSAAAIAREQQKMEQRIEEGVEEALKKQREQEFIESLEEIQRDKERYWINLNSNTRHNHKCRYFKNTANGRFGSKDEGKACPSCGG